MSLSTFLFGGKQQPKQQGMLSVFVLEARNLKKGVLGSTRDVYVTVRLVSTVGSFIRLEKTRVCSKTLAPNWANPAEEHVFPVALPGGDELEVIVYDKVTVGLNDDVLGQFRVSVKQHLGVQLIDNWWPLGAGCGELHLVTMYHGEQQVQPPAPPSPEWTLAYDKIGRLHYLNKFTNATSWVCPVVAVPQAPPMQYAPPVEIAQAPPTAPPAAIPQAEPTQQAPAGMYPPMAAPQEDINAFLTNNGLAHLIPVFAKERIDMMVLRSLTEPDLTSLGLAFGDKRKITLLLGKQ